MFAAMTTIFLVCALLGGGILVLQLFASLLGLGLGMDAEHHVADGAVDGLNLLTVRGLAAALAFFGITGSGVLAAGLGTVLATVLGVVAGAAAATAVALVLRRLRNLETDGVVRIEGAVGLSGRVHVRVPDGAREPGKVLLTLQERLVEVPAVSLDGELPTGTAITVVGVAGPDTVEVVRTPDPGE